MYINLILGAVAIAAVWLLVEKLFEKNRRSGATENDGGNAGEVLARELESRRAKQAACRSIHERMLVLRQQHVDKAARALLEMQNALPQSDRNVISWKTAAPATLELTVCAAVQTETRCFTLSWQVGNMDLNDQQWWGQEPEGKYTLRFPGGSLETFDTLEDLTHCLAKLVADALTQEAEV